MQPDVRVNVHAAQDLTTCNIELADQSLHQRGYRCEQTTVPLKETLAAAILPRARWPRLAAGAPPLLNPMCGSVRCRLRLCSCRRLRTRLDAQYFEFVGWQQHDAAMWTALIEEARERRRAGFKSLPPIVGYDSNARAELAAYARIGHHALANCAKSVHADRGLLVMNPPYG